MEQYFAKQLSNCCKLNFSNHVIKTQKPLLSPKNSPQKVLRTINKSEKKSLKRVHSDQALTMTRKTNLNLQFQPKKEPELQKREKIFDDYGNLTNQIVKIEAAQTKQMKKVFSAQNLFTQGPSKSQNQIIFVDSNKKKPINEQINYGLAENKSPIKMAQVTQHFPVSMVRIEKPEYLPQNFYYIAQNPQPINFQKAPNISHQKYYPQKEYQINNFSKNQIQSPFVKEKFNKLSNEIKQFQQSKVFQSSQQKPKSRQSTFGQSEYFNKIYDEADLQQQIKKDLIKSLDFNKNYTQTENLQNGISVLIKSPSTNQSTIIPLESKLTKKGDWHDSFNYDKRYQTQKVLKVQKPQNQLSVKIRIDRRQKFKSIVSVDSQHQSSQAVDSIIIQQHPQHLISSKPLKSLL